MIKPNKVLGNILGNPIIKDNKSKNKTKRKEKCVYCGKETTDYQLYRDGPVCYECLSEPDYML